MSGNATATPSAAARYAAERGPLTRRPRSAAEAGLPSAAARRADIQRFRVRDRLDSDSSEDEEAAELSYFWQQVRSLREQPGGDRGEREAAQAPAPGADGPQAAAALRPVWQSVAPPAAPPPPSRRPLLPNLVQSTELSSLLSAAAGSLSPKMPGGRRRHLLGSRIPGVKLWAALAELTFEVLCFLPAPCIHALACVAVELLELCSFPAAGGRHLLRMPRLELHRHTAEQQSQQVWWPNMLWLDSRDVEPQECSSLFAGISRRGPEAPRALLSLEIRSTRLQGHCVESLGSILRMCRGLRTLVLSRTRLRDQGAERIISGLLTEDRQTGCKFPHRALRHLALDENNLTSAFGKHLATAVSGLPALEVLLLARNELGDSAAVELADALLAGVAATTEGSIGATGHFKGGGATLMKLDFSENRLSAQGLLALTGILGPHGALRNLDAGGNERIGASIVDTAAHVRGVAAGLRSAVSLIDLHLWRCGLNDEACDLVMDAQPPQLRLLNLAANPFSQELRERLLHRLDCTGLALCVTF